MRAGKILTGRVGQRVGVTVTGRRLRLRTSAGDDGDAHGTGGEHDQRVRHHYGQARGVQQAGDEAGRDHGQGEDAVCPGDNRAAGGTLDGAGRRVDRHVGGAGRRAEHRQSRAQGGQVVSGDGHGDAGDAECREGDRRDAVPPSVHGPAGEGHGGQGACGDEQQRRAQLAVGQPGLVADGGHGRAPHAPERAEDGESRIWHPGPEPMARLCIGTHAV